MANVIEWEARCWARIWNAIVSLLTGDKRFVPAFDIQAEITRRLKTSAD
jgi:hypothetical protein